MTIAYPAELPVPQTSTVTPVERRALADADYPREAVALQRDRAQIEEITFPPMRLDKLAIFWSWWRIDLIYGGAWFAATWPLPVGMVSAVRKFIGTPQREYIAPGFWRITAVCEVRGAGVIDLEQACDCSHIAWILNPDSDVITADQLPALRGDFTITATPSVVSISDVDPLYGTYSIRIGSDDDLTGAVIDLTNPAIPIVDAWTISFSVKAPAGGGGVTFTLWKPEDGFEFCRIEFRKFSGGDSQEFFYFDATTFNTGTYSDYAYETLYNCEFNSSDGRLRFFVNGVMLLDRSTGASRSIGHITCAAGTGNEATTLQLDEIKVSNQAEHTADYTPALPFCVCEELETVALFLDLFNGSEGTQLSEHTQDIRLNESVWLSYGEYYLPVLSGTGSAGKFGEDPPIFGPMGAQTTFGIVDPETFETTYPALKPGWILDAVITPLQSVGGDPGTQAYSEIRVESATAYVLIRFIPESPSDSPALIFDIAGLAEVVTYPLPGGTSTLSVLLEADGATLTINGVAQDKAFSEIGAAGVPFVLQNLHFILGVETGGEEPRPTSSIQMVSISGELDETATIVTANTQTVDVAGLIHGSAYVAAYPSAGLWGDHAGMFDDQGSKAETAFTDEGLQATIAGPATSTTTLASSSVDLDIGVLVAEYIIDHFDPAISYLAFGSYSDFGPGANVEEFFGGKEGVCAYLRNDGTASQYGGSATGPTFTQGDVIALIFDNDDGEGALHVWKNGVYIGVPLRLADNTTARAVVSVTPKV